MSFSLKIAAVLAAGASAYTSVNISQCKDAAKDLDKSNLSNQNMFDPEMLERGAKAIRDIDRSANAKAVRSATIFLFAKFFPCDTYFIRLDKAVRLAMFCTSVSRPERLAHKTAPWISCSRPRHVVIESETLEPTMFPLQIPISTLLSCPSMCM